MAVVSVQLGDYSGCVFQALGEVPLGLLSPILTPLGLGEGEMEGRQGEQKAYNVRVCEAYGGYTVGPEMLPSSYVGQSQMGRGQVVEPKLHVNNVKVKSDSGGIRADAW